MYNIIVYILIQLYVEQRIDIDQNAELDGMFLLFIYLYSR